MGNSWIVCISLWLCSMVSSSHQTARFSTSLFSPGKESSCTPDAVQKAIACTSKLNPLGTVGPMSNQNTPLSKALEDGCEQGIFFDAVNCIERVMLDCRHDKSTGAHFLRTNMNVENTRKSIIYFCTNLKTYTSNLGCIKSSLPSMSECGSEAKANFISQMQATSNVDSQMRFQCSFFSKAVSCAKSILKSHCNKEISTMVFTVMAGLEPPICYKSKYSVSAGMKQQDQAGSQDGDGESGAATLETYLVLNCLSCFVILLLWKVNVRWW